MSWAEEQPWFGCEDIILEQITQGSYYIEIGKAMIGPFNTQKEAENFFYEEVKPKITKITTTIKIVHEI